MKLSESFKHRDTIAKANEGQRSSSMNVSIRQHYGETNLDGSRKWCVSRSASEEHVFATFQEAVAFMRKGK